MNVSLEDLVVVPCEVAYDRAYEAHWTTVFRFALAWTNEWGAAEDVAQETFTRLWRHRSDVEWDRDIRPWLLVTARHLVTDRFRTFRRRFLGLLQPPTLDEATAIRWLDVQQAMKQLSSLERSAIVLTVLDGRESTEAAKVLGISPGAVRAAVSRGRHKLGEDL